MVMPVATLVKLLTPKRTSLQFRLRTLLVLVLVGAIPCGWLKWKLVRKREAVVEIERLGGQIRYDWQITGKKDPPGAPWLRKLLGEDVLANVVYVTLPARQRIFVGERTGLEYRLSSADYDPGVRDDDLQLVAIFPYLQALDLTGAEIGDAGLAYLRELAYLYRLNLNRTKLTDAGLAQLKELTKLGELNLIHTAVTDAGLVHLKELGGLDRLFLRGTCITKAGVSELKKALPNCEIIR
jgi:hypothetical protein